MVLRYFRCFENCKLHIKNKKFAAAAISLLMLPIGLPYIFFNSPKAPPIKLDIFPQVNTVQPNQAKVNYQPVTYYFIYRFIFSLVPQ